LGKYKGFRLSSSWPDEYAYVAVRKLAKLHAEYWGDKSNVFTESPEFKKFVPYIYFMTFTVNRWTRYPQTKEQVRKRFRNWASAYPVFQNPTAQELMETFVDIFPKLIKYFNNDIAKSGPLFRQHTFLHGDYNPGNLFFDIETPTEEDQTPQFKDLILIDWQGYGVGHPSTELAWFLGFIAPDMDRDMRLVQMYYEELTKIVPREIYPFEVMMREVEIRTMGLGISSFNNFDPSPEEMKKRDKTFSRNGLQSEDFLTSRSFSVIRMSRFLEQWQKAGILQNLDKLEEII